MPPSAITSDAGPASAVLIVVAANATSNVAGACTEPANARTGRLTTVAVESAIVLPAAITYRSTGPAVGAALMTSSCPSPDTGRVTSIVARATTVPPARVVTSVRVSPDVRITEPV